MSFRREGIDFDAINLVKRRRVEELLSDDIPEDEATLTKNGRFACLVCTGYPVLDTAEMLCVHRRGKKHKSYEEHFFRKKRELHQLVEKRRQEAASSAHSNDRQSTSEAPLLLQARKSQNALLRYAPYNPISYGAQSGQNLPDDFKTKRSKNKGFFEYTRNYLTNNVPLRISQGRFTAEDRNPPPPSENPNPRPNLLRGHGLPPKGSDSSSGDHSVILKPYISKRKQSKKRADEDESRSDETAGKVLDGDRSPRKVSEVGSSYSRCRRRKWEGDHQQSGDWEEGILKKRGQESLKESGFTQQPISEYPPAASSDCDLNAEERNETNTGRRRRRRSDDVTGHEAKLGIDKRKTKLAGNGDLVSTVQGSRSDSRREGPEIPQKGIVSASTSNTLQQSVTDVQEGKIGGQQSRQKLKVEKTRRKYDYDVQENDHDGLSENRTGPPTTDNRGLHVGGRGGRPTFKMKEGKTGDLKSSSEKYLTNSGSPKPCDLNSVCSPLEVNDQNLQPTENRQPMKSGPPVKFSFMSSQPNGSSAAQNLSDKRASSTSRMERTDSVVEKAKDVKTSAPVLELRKSKYSEERKRELEKHLELTSSGWIHDPSGGWVKDENVEFDSDEEEPITRRGTTSFTSVLTTNEVVAAHKDLRWCEKIPDSNHLE